MCINSHINMQAGNYIVMNNGSEPPTADPSISVLDAEVLERENVSVFIIHIHGVLLSNITITGI